MIGRRRKARDAVLVPAVERKPEEALGEDPQRTVPRFGHGSRVPGWDDAVDLTKDPSEIPDPATTPVDATLREEIEAHMSKYPDFRSAAIPALAAAQRHHGWCSPEAIEQVACVMRLTPGYLVAVASFYDMLETRPVGRHSIYVCTNISCALRGGDDIYEAMREAGGDRTRFNVRSFECLGACDIAPMASVGGTYVGPLTREDVPVLFEQLAAGEEVLPDKQLLRRKAAVTHWEGERTGGRAAKGPTAATNDVEGPGEI